MAKYRVVITDRLGSSYDIEKQVLEPADAEVFNYHCLRGEGLIEICRDADAIMCNLADIPKEVVESLTHCKIIAKYGIGLDNFAIDACTQKGIWVSNVPDYCLNEVSEHALALMMACARNLVRKTVNIRAGAWDVLRKDKLFRMHGKTLTLLGFGNIPRALLKKVSGFGMKVLVYDPFVDADTISREGGIKTDWDEALRAADFISVHLPLNKNTSNMIDEKAFGLMKDTVVLVNTSRGGVIDEPAMIGALKTGKIAFAGLDVFADEPLAAPNELLELDNCILTDHVAWYSRESLVELKTKCAKNVREVLLGNKPIYPVNNPIIGKEPAGTEEGPVQFTGKPMTF